MKNHDTLILGGGLAGLSAGYHLRGDCLIFERESEAGGLCRSFNDNGFSFDYAPHILYPQDTYTRKLIKGLLGNNLRTQKREAWIYHNSHKVYTRFPFQAHLHGLPSGVISRCLRSLEKERSSSPGGPPGNYHQWLVRNFGSGMAKEFLVPYSKKIWTVHPSRMNCDWIADRVARPRYADILTGAKGDPGKRFGFNTEFWYPVRGGIGALAKAFFRAQQGPVRLGKEVTAIDTARRTVTINGRDRYSYRNIISTLPLPDLIARLKDVPAKVKKAGRDLKFNRVMCVNLGVERGGISDRHWIYYHDPAFIFNRISLPKNLSSRTGPGHTSSICTEITLRPDERPRSSEIIRRVIRQLISTGLLTRQDRIIRKNILKLDYAYVIYDLHHRKNVDLIHAYLKTKKSSRPVVSENGNISTWTRPFSAGKERP